MTVSHLVQTLQHRAPGAHGPSYPITRRPSGSTRRLSYSPYTRSRIPRVVPFYSRLRTTPWSGARLRRWAVATWIRQNFCPVAIARSVLSAPSPLQIPSAN